MKISHILSLSLLMKKKHHFDGVVRIEPKIFWKRKREREKKGREGQEMMAMEITDLLRREELKFEGRKMKDIIFHDIKIYFKWSRNQVKKRERRENSRERERESFIYHHVFKNFFFVETRLQSQKSPVMQSSWLHQLSFFPLSSTDSLSLFLDFFSVSLSLSLSLRKIFLKEWIG